MSKFPLFGQKLVEIHHFLSKISELVARFE